MSLGSVKSAVARAALGAAFAVIAPLSAHATIVNGDFETGTLAPWTSIGNVLVDSGAIGAGPLGGAHNAFLSTGFTKFPGGPEETGETATDIESFLGLASGSLGAVTPFGVTEGSAMKQSFTAAAGDTITADFQIFSDDCAAGVDPGCQDVEDFVYITVVVDGVLDVFSSFDPTMVLSGSLFVAESDVMSFSHSIVAGGVVEIGFAVLDGDDDEVDTAILVDNVLLTTVSVAEPATLGLFALGLAGLGLAARRRKTA